MSITQAIVCDDCGEIEVMVSHRNLPKLWLRKNDSYREGDLHSCPDCSVYRCYCCDRIISKERYASEEFDEMCRACFSEAVEEEKNLLNQ